MSPPVLIGFAGVLVAAVVTGMLAGRCVRRPRIALIAWTAATLALTAALAAESKGFASGFGPAVFRAVQLFALLLAPLWTAWGLAEQLWPGEAARFGARLICGALTVVGSVILATDPLTAQPFGKSWPPAGQHYQPPSHYALAAAQAVAVISTVATAGLAVARARNDGQRRGELAGAALVGLAVLITVAQRFSLPAGSLYPLFGLAAAALIWSGAVRLDHLAGRRPDPAGRSPLPPAAGPGAEPDGAEAGYGGQAQSAGPPAATPARPYGRILIFTLLDDRVADFDRFAEQAAEEVRTREPGTVVYVIHLVPNAPMQRIFYEIYRDRDAFDRHERQPYMQRFVAERRSCVLATNVIELRLKYAKVAPLPAPPPGQPLQGAPRAQLLQPLPPGPDRRQPSAGRRHGGS